MLQDIKSCPSVSELVCEGRSVPCAIPAVILCCQAPISIVLVTFQLQQPCLLL